MISVNEAKALLQQNITALPAKKCSLKNAAGLVLAEDIFSSVNIPAFQQSSMDGYAFSFEGWVKNKKLKITKTISAGEKKIISIDAKSAARIFTGAAMPTGTDTVVMQEKTKTESEYLIVEDENIKLGTNVRAIGSEIKKGSLALAKNTLLTPAAIGLLATIGVEKVSVYPQPKIGLIITGNELQKPGKKLQHGQVYEANSFSLSIALQQYHFNNIQLFYAKDSLTTLTATLKKALQQNDVVLLTGGISVGDFDFVLQATINNKVEKIFHRIKQRPGKPLYVGKKKNKVVFGLPGNPASVLTTFYEYVIPALGKMMNQNLELKKLTAPLSHDFKKPTGLTHFLKGMYDGKTATVLDAQESFKLSSFAKANCIIQINEEVDICKKETLVEIHLLRN